MGTPETSREPCPDRILDDVGGAFGMGAVGGSAFHFLKGIYNSPKGERLIGGTQAVRMNAPRIGGSFAVWGGLFSSFDCTMVYLRQKEDPWNSIIAGAATGGFLQMRQGLGAASRSALFGGVLLALIEGAGIMLNKVMSAPQNFPPMEEPLPNVPGVPGYPSGKLPGQPHVKLDGVVTLVDSKHALQHLNKVKPRFVSNEAVEQVAYADRIILNKIDLVTESELEVLTKRIKHINGMAQIKKAKHGVVDMDFVLGVGGYDLDRVDSEVQSEGSHCGHKHEDEHEHHKGHHHDHVHDSAVSSVSIVSEGTLDLDEVDDWLERLIEENGDDLYRMKGVLSVSDSEQRYVFQGVHSVLDGCPGKTWEPNEKRINKLVFIGRNLDETALRKGFKGCLCEE